MTTKTLRRALSLILLVLLSACATSPSMLIFADNVTFGLQVGGSSAATGGNITLGYRNRSAAVVPMSVIDESGVPQALRSNDGDSKDALSVFAVFSASGSGAQGTTSNALVNTGQMFSTGVAAQQITQGFMCRSLPTDRECEALVRAPEATADAASAAAKSAMKSAVNAARAASAAVDSARVARASAVKASAAAPAAIAAAEPAVTASKSSAPYQWPLVFGRTDVFGFDITGSATEQGVTFTLGLGVKNLALVPTYIPNDKGPIRGLYAGSEGVDKDAFSVLGQFNANTQTTRLGFGLERYFATGLAAQNLARGIASNVAAAASAPATAAQPK